MLENEKYDAAYYLAGYAVECALKACIAKQTKRFDFPDKRIVDKSHVHNLKDLLSVSGLKQLHQQESEGDAEFEANWRVVTDWSQHHRYQLGHSAAKARDLYAAITGRKHGILTWLKKQW